MTTILCIGDPHFKVDNITEVDLFIERIVKLAQEQAPDFIVCLGDLLDTHERIHTTALNRAYNFINQLRNISPTYVLVGNHDMCFDADTSIMTWNTKLSLRENKLAKHIEVGDILVGSRLKTVVSLIHGYGNRYEIKQNNACTYIVNSKHILALFDTDMCKYVEMTALQYEKLTTNEQSKLRGYKENMQLSHISIKHIGLGEYYGFEINGDRLFFLADSTVVHNCNNQQFLTENHWMNGMKEWRNVKIADKVIVDNINGEKYVFMPYVAPGRFQEALDTVGDEWKGANIIFAHQEFKGCKMGAFISTDGDEWSVDNPFIVSGHIHSKQTIQDNIYYAGAAMQHAFGESEHNIIPIITVVEDSMEFDEVDLALPRKKIIYKDVEEIEDYNPPESDDKIKLTVSGVYEQFKTFKKTQKYKSLISSGVKIVFKPKKIIHESIMKKTDKEVLSFSHILDGIIKQQDNSNLTDVYEILRKQN